MHLRSSCLGARGCGLAHQGWAAYGVVLLAIGILVLGVALLALTWHRRTPSPSTSEETENDA